MYNDNYVKSNNNHNGTNDVDKDGCNGSNNDEGNSNDITAAINNKNRIIADFVLN